MKFWSRIRAPVQSASKNPFRALDPTAFDKGEKINRRAGELQHIAASGLGQADAITALGTALGNEVAAMVVRHPALSVEGILDTACGAVRDAAYIAAELSTNNEDAKELTSQEFNELAARILSTATTKTLPNDAISATAKALGVLISFSARRHGCSAEELIKFSQEAVASFAQEALNSMD